MAHKTFIGGTAYEITNGKPLVDSTAYTIASGRTLISGTGYDISFAGEPLTVYNGGTDVELGTVQFRYTTVQTANGVVSPTTMREISDTYGTYASISNGCIYTLYTSSGQNVNGVAAATVLRGRVIIGPIDFTPYSNLTITGYVDGSDASGAFGYTGTPQVLNTSGVTTAFTASSSFSSASEAEYTLDISEVSGEKYIMISNTSTSVNGKTYVSNITLS